MADTKPRYNRVEARPATYAPASPSPIPAIPSPSLARSHSPTTHLLVHQLILRPCSDVDQSMMAVVGSYLSGWSSYLPTSIKGATPATAASDTRDRVLSCQFDYIDTPYGRYASSSICTQEYRSLLLTRAGLSLSLSLSLSLDRDATHLNDLDVLQNFEYLMIAVYACSCATRRAFKSGTSRTSERHAS